MAVSTESVRWSIMESIERCYYVGAIPGQEWLRNLSAFLHSLPSNDRRFIRLASIGSAPPPDDFIALSRPPAAGAFVPSTWLDDYVEWALTTRSTGPSSHPTPRPPGRRRSAPTSRERREAPREAPRATAA